ncbi:DUF4157 domain-containing protein [Micromonospora sp. AP08]|uniref:eCIS core domain-containing protein n=1 Tax=Micromonospora sp. AP08 TaxID=2604467 RepID=UPI0011DB85A7|nr:DUF4157 domain-containing protein [Micromonospora sp. AP08]TYB39673.1 DUF4157 domain-containing protein [Micromonospora sp. AP08]
MSEHEYTSDHADSGGTASRPAQDTYEAQADRAADRALATQPQSFARSANASSSSGGGRPLTSAESAYFEPRFGYDFASVRIHADTAASRRADALGAAAFTQGSSITFSRPPDMNSTAGRRLMAHELAHVVQQSRTPALAGTVQRQPKTAPGIKKVLIYRKAKKISVILTDGTMFTLKLVKEEGTLPPGSYTASHVKDNPGGDSIKTSDNKEVGKLDKLYIQPPPGVPYTWTELATSEYEITIYDLRRPGSRDEELQSDKGAKGGKGSQTSGSGTGSGTGSGDAKDGGKKGGDKTGGDKDRKGGDTGGTEQGLPPESDAEKKAKVDRVLKELKSVSNAQGKPLTKEQLDKFAEMSSAELADVLKYLKTTAAESDTPIDESAELDKYLQMSPSDRELLRINQHLLTDAKAGELPDDVKIALTVSSDKTKTLAENTAKVNDALKNLKKIHAKVTHDTLLDKAEADLDPIELEKLPVFREMMMLEGLLAGASQRSAKIEESAKDLTKSIAGIRDYVLEEILWLAAELGASYIIGALTGPIGTGLAAARGAMLLHRLNKLRKFLQKVEQVYSTYQRITSIVSKVSAAYATYKSFEANFADGLAELGRLQDLTDDPNLDEKAAELAVEKLEEQENKLVEKMLAQLENNTGVGALLEYFDIPEDATEEDLRQILFNIPKGLQELNALMARYRASGRDLEAVKLLTYKSVLVGALLYPFVGFLAREIGSKLSDLMTEQDLSDRLLNVIDRASRGKQGYKAPGAAKTRAKLKTAKHKPRAKPKTPSPTKKDPGKPVAPHNTKKKGDADPDKDVSKPHEPNKKAPPTQDDSAKPKTPAKSGDTNDPARKPETDNSPDAKKKADEPDQDKPSKKKTDPDKDSDKNEPKDSKDPKDPNDPKDPKNPKDPKDPKSTGPDDVEWQQVVMKVNALPGKNLTEGATKNSLLKQANKIKKKHSKVCGRVAVGRVADKGEWRVTIARKGSPTVKAEAQVLMGYRDRWEAGRKAVERAVGKLDAASRTKATIESAIAQFKTAYSYAALDVVDHTTADRSGFTVVGRMGNAARRDIADVDDLNGLHTGEKSDPIPIYWYKDKSWYPGYAKPMKLTIDGEAVDFRMTDGPRDVTLKDGTKVPIGVDKSNIVEKGTLLYRERGDERDPTPIDNFKSALKHAGYSQWEDKDIDHIRDLAFQGTNRYSNLWPLNREKNRHAFNGTWYRNYGIQYLEKKGSTKLLTGTLYTLTKKWFTVEGIEPRVRGYGGRSKAKP